MFQDHQVAYLRGHVKVKEVRRLSFLRKSVGYVLSRSARKVPHAAVIAHFDLTPLVDYGKRDTETPKPEGQRRSKDDLLDRAIRRNFSAFFIKAIAHCLCRVPELNAFLDYAPWRTGGKLYLAEDINLSFTVHTKHGVIKPIVRNPHQKDLKTVASEMRELARRARRTDPEELYRKAARAYMSTAIRQLDIGALGGLWIWICSNLTRQAPDPAFKDVKEDQKLQVQDILGATCTVANIGMMMSGHQTVTVVIPPEVAMFGIGDVRLAPWVVDGEIQPRYAVTIAATCDHRAFDGGEVFPCYERMKYYIDNPALIYEWKPGDEI
jgi:pyruvate/2-oxoglutarate dehydrogenase complex dihydrolipoamide acyltransferase (E2) component